MTSRPTFIINTNYGQRCDFDHLENGNTYRKNWRFGMEARSSEMFFPSDIPKEDNPAHNAPLRSGVTALFFTKTEEGLKTLTSPSFPPVYLNV